MSGERKLGLGRRVQFDERSRSYDVADHPAFSAVARSRTWPCAIRLDQGQTSACTGFSRSYDLAATPRPVGGIDGSFAETLYHLAQADDGFQHSGDDGSSVLGAVKAAEGEGYVGEYRWAFSIGDALGAISSLGPVVVGSDWYESMFSPREEIIQLDLDSGVAGGHAYLLRGVIYPHSGVIRTTGFSTVRATEPHVRILNSWGAGWGVGGEALLAASDLAELLNREGEACVTTVPFAKPT